MGSISANGSPDKTLSAAIYVRVSTRDQEDGTSLSTQEERCRQYAYEHGYRVPDEHVYREVHTGVELWERPQLTRLREAMRRHVFNALIVYAIDRLARDPVHLGVVLSEADHHGVRVEFVTEPLDSSPEGQLIRFVRGYSAKIEHEKIKERMMRGRKARVERGKYMPGGKPPFGYRWLGDSKDRLIVHPDEAVVVQRIFREALAGVPIRQIARTLTQEGIPNPHGGVDWHPSTIHCILANVAYTGQAKSLGMPLPDGVVPSLVDHETFAGVQERRRWNKVHATRNNKTPELFLLRGGFVRCGHCGYTMRAHRWIIEGRTQLFYSCLNTVRRCPEHPAISTRALDAAVWKSIRARLLDPEIIKAELRRQSEDDSTVAQDLVAVERRIAEIDRRQKNVVANLGLVSGPAAEVVVQHIKDLDAQKQRLLTEREAIVARQKAAAENRQRLDAIDHWLRAVSTNLDALDYHGKRLVLEALDVEVRVYKVGHAPRWEVRASIPIDSPPDGDPIVSSFASTACMVHDRSLSPSPLPPGMAMGRSLINRRWNRRWTGFFTSPSAGQSRGSARRSR